MRAVRTGIFVSGTVAEWDDTDNNTDTSRVRQVPRQRDPKMTNELALPVVTGSAVDHPRHYNSHKSGIEAIEVIEYLTGNMFNTVKYIWRANHKGKPVEDIEKALWYAKREAGRFIQYIAPVPQFVFDKTDKYVAAEEDKLRASIVYVAVDAHRDLSTYKENIRRVVVLLEQLLEQAKTAEITA
jgi:hypothetical protein